MARPLLPRDRKTHLTAPHPCHYGKHPINKSFGQRQATIRCDECLATTSIYAAIYFCPRCTKRQTLLESPKSQWGKTTVCPNCESDITVPNDDVLREVDTQRRDGTWFSFPCPACDKALACAIRHSGAWVVCPHCTFAIQVRAGNRVEPAATSSDVNAPRQVLQAVGIYPCPGCGTHIPKGCHRCPMCSSHL